MYKYFSLELPLDVNVSGQIPTDDLEVEAEYDRARKSATDKLETMGIEWRHEYFMGGCGYYVFVRLEPEHDDSAEKFAFLQSYGDLRSVSEGELPIVKRRFGDDTPTQAS